MFTHDDDNDEDDDGVFLYGSFIKALDHNCNIWGVNIVKKVKNLF